MELKYTNWGEITIPIYEELMSLVHDEVKSEDAFYQREIDIMAVLCDADRDSVGRLTIEEYTALAQQSQFIRNMPAWDVPDKVTIGDTKYRITTNQDTWTLAQFTEWQCLRATPTTTTAQLLACILIPEGYKHYADGYDVQKVIDDITAHLPYYKAFAILNFFHSAQLLSALGMLRYTAKKVRAQARKTTDKAEKKRLLREAKSMRKAYIGLGATLLRKSLTTH